MAFLQSSISMQKKETLSRQLYQSKIHAQQTKDLTARCIFGLAIKQTQNNLIFTLLNKQKGVIGWCSGKGKIKNKKTRAELYRKTARTLIKLFQRKTSKYFRWSIKKKSIENQLVTQKNIKAYHSTFGEYIALRLLQNKELQRVNTQETPRTWELISKLRIIPVVRTTVYYNGTVSAGRKILLQLKKQGLQMHRVIAYKPLSFNGCRPKKLARK